MTLPENFELERYGLHCRLVNENDAEFIVSLRSDSKLGQYLHASDGDISKQIQWTREYKKREANGEDFYFVFDVDGERVGVHRIYNVNWERLTFTYGSWVCKSNTPLQYVALTDLMTEEIAFDILGLKMNLYDVRKGNSKVLRFHREIVNSIQYGENDLDCLFYMTEETRKKNQIKTLLNL